MSNHPTSLFVLNVFVRLSISASVDDPTRKLQIVTFIVWRIILRFQICDDIPKGTKIKNSHYKRAPRRLLKWIRSILPEHATDVSNFNTEWTNGVLLCELVNALGEELIPTHSFSDKHSSEINIRHALTTADDVLGVPELFSPYDLAAGKVDDKCVMTYLSLIRSADKIKRRDGTTSKSADENIENDVECNNDDDDSILSTFKKLNNRIRHKRPKCIAFGAGLRWGQVGKPSEFFLQVNGPEFSDLSVSIECRPFDRRTTDYKPGLEIKSVNSSSCYVVKYTPTRPGEYVVSVFCAGEHIDGSPFHLEIHETVLTTLFQDDEIRITFNPAKVSFVGRHITDSDSSPSSSSDTISDNSLDSVASAKTDDSAFYDDEDDDDVDDENSESPAKSTTESTKNSTKKLTKKSSEKKDRKQKKKEKTISTSKLEQDQQVISVQGAGLKGGEVGLVSAFQVYTPSQDKVIDLSSSPPPLSPIFFTKKIK